MSPEFRNWPRLVKENERSLQTLIVDTCRNELLMVAAEYTKRVTGKVPNLPTDHVIATGHQAVWHHCGILAKNYVAQVLAEQIDGCCLHLVLDHDIYDTEFALARESGGGEILIDEISIEDERRSIPLEFRAAPAFEQLQHFLDSIKGSDHDFSNAVWQECDKHWFPGDACLNVADTVTSLQSALYSSLGIEMLYLPVSMMSESDSFMAFVISIMRDAGTFANVYNDALEHQEGYGSGRSVKLIKPLNIDSEKMVVELPFWLVTSSGERFTLNVLNERSERITFGTDSNAGSSFSLAGDLEPVEALRECLAAGNFRLRPKAVALTLFIRLNLCDFFVHGVGGAAYEAITDRMIEGYYGFNIPHYGVATASVPLSMRYQRDEEFVEPEELKAKIRKMRVSPECFMEDSSVEEPIVKCMVNVKHKLIKVSHDTNLSSIERRSAWSKIRRVNERLVQYARPSLIQVREQLTFACQQKNVLSNRNFFFGFFPKEKLIEFLTLEEGQ